MLPLSMVLPLFPRGANAHITYLDQLQEAILRKLAGAGGVGAAWSRGMNSKAAWSKTA